MLTAKRFFSFSVSYTGNLVSTFSNFIIISGHFLAKLTKYHMQDAADEKNITGAASTKNKKENMLIKKKSFNCYFDAFPYSFGKN